MLPNYSHSCNGFNSIPLQVSDLKFSSHLECPFTNPSVQYLLWFCCVFLCEPAVTPSVAMACSSCVMASLSSSLLRGIFIWSGFFAASSVSIHWKGQIRDRSITIKKKIFYTQIELKDQISGEAYFLWGPVLRNLDIWENPGHRLFREILRKKQKSSQSVSKCVCLNVCVSVHDLPFLSKGCYKSLRRAGQCWQWNWSAWWGKRSVRNETYNTGKA